MAVPAAGTRGASAGGQRPRFRPLASPSRGRCPPSPPAAVFVSMLERRKVLVWGQALSVGCSRAGLSVCAGRGGPRGCGGCAPPVGPEWPSCSCSQHPRHPAGHQKCLLKSHPVNFRGLFPLPAAAGAVWRPVGRGWRSWGRRRAAERSETGAGKGELPRAGHSARHRP